MPGCYKLSLASGEGAGIYAKGHGKRRLIDIDGGERLRIYGIRHCLSNMHIAKARQGHDLTEPG